MSNRLLHSRFLPTAIVLVAGISWSCNAFDAEQERPLTGHVSAVVHDKNTEINANVGRDCPPADQARLAEAFIDAKWAGATLFAYMSSYRYFSKCISECTFDKKRILVQIDADGDRSVRFERPWRQERFLDVSKDGSTFVFADSRKMYIVNGAGDTMKTLDGDAYSDIVLSPDGSRALLAEKNDKGWYLTHIAEHTIKKMSILSNDRAENIVWSPDGEKLVYINTAEGARTLTVVGKDETSRVELSTVCPSGKLVPAWTEKCDAVMYYEQEYLGEEVQRGAAANHLYKIGLAPGATPEHISHIAGVVSSDGTRVAVIPRSVGILEIYDTATGKLVYGDGALPCG